MVNPQSAGKSTQPEAPQARAALDSMKYEIAKELGIIQDASQAIAGAELDKLTDALKCQLRHDMLHTYYRHREGRTIRQYELENFLYLYRRYKALGGNSFIDRIKSEIDEWEVIS